MGGDVVIYCMTSVMYVHLVKNHIVYLLCARHSTCVQHYGEDAIREQNKVSALLKLTCNNTNKGLM